MIKGLFNKRCRRASQCRLLFLSTFTNLTFLQQFLFYPNISHPLKTGYNFNCSGIYSNTRHHIQNHLLHHLPYPIHHSAIIPQHYYFRPLSFRHVICRPLTKKIPKSRVMIMIMARLTIVSDSATLSSCDTTAGHNKFSVRCMAFLQNNFIIEFCLQGMAGNKAVSYFYLGKA